MKKKKSSCGCKHETIREMLGSRLCFENQTKSDIFEMHNFNKSKPFKVTFKEDIDVTWNPTSLEEKTMTARDMEQKHERAEELMPHMKELVAQYGKRGKGILHAIATKYALETP